MTSSVAMSAYSPQASFSSTSSTQRTERLVRLPDQYFEGLYVHHFERLTRSLTAITGDREVARDCVQEAFVKAALRWHRVGRLDDPVGWIRRAAINRSHDVYRAETRRRKREEGFQIRRPPVDTAKDYDSVDACQRPWDNAGWWPVSCRLVASETARWRPVRLS